MKTGILLSPGWTGLLLRDLSKGYVCTFQGPSFYPLSHPPLSTEEILEHPTLCKIALDLAMVLDCRSLFAEPGEVDIHGAT